MKLGQFAERDPAAEAEAAAREEADKKEAEAVPVGSRCEVALPGAVPKRGTVMFVGKWGSTLTQLKAYDRRCGLGGACNYIVD